MKLLLLSSTPDVESYHHLGWEAVAGTCECGHGRDALPLELDHRAFHTGQLLRGEVLHARLIPRQAAVVRGHRSICRKRLRNSRACHS